MGDRPVADMIAEEPILRAIRAKTLACAAIVAAGLVMPASAATVAGVTLPDTYPVDGVPIKLNGIGLRTVTVFNVRVYVAGLYLQQPSHDAQQILKSAGAKVILLHFLHAGTKEQVEKQYREGEANNCSEGGCAASDKTDFEQLVAAAPAVAVGDRSIYVFNGNRVRVYANDRLIADFVNQDLAYQLLAGFIGKHPPTPSLRRHLLGLPDE